MAKYKRKPDPKQPLLIAVLALTLAALLAVALFVTQEPDPTLSTQATETTGTVTEATETTDPPTEPPTQPPTEPPIVKESTATISATGDMLMHLPVINRYKSGSDYNFDGIFSYFLDYVTASDYAVANLETTLCGTDNGYKYSGWPAFNCPDAIVDSLKNAGFDMLLTANNHTYDTRRVGMLRTLDTITDRGLAYLGTRYTPDYPDFILQEINGITIGMACYTYNTGTSANGSVSLNEIPLKPEDSGLVNSFDYSNLPAFYEEMEANLKAMKEQGADATVLFIHWGNEYHLKNNSTQTAIAQKLCDLGVDVIIGGHPHVVQPVELLTSTADENHKTVCLYSMGNAVSNQRQGNLKEISTAHTEDGVLFSITFAKYSDGTVILESAKLLPLWVNSRYQILPLDEQIEDWKTQFGVSDSDLAKMQASLKRTNAIVTSGMTQVDAYLKNHVSETEARLNVGK